MQHIVIQWSRDFLDISKRLFHEKRTFFTTPKNNISIESILQIFSEKPSFSFLCFGNQYFENDCFAYFPNSAIFYVKFLEISCCNRCFCTSQVKGHLFADQLCEINVVLRPVTLNFFNFNQ